MCITIGPARLEKTILLANSVELDGRTINVIGYQNVATNQDHGPNAMVLPFPAATPMTQANCIDVSGHPDLLKRYAALVPREQTRSMSRGLTLSAKSAAEVFDSGSYTVVLASDATAIPEAIDRVPAHRRPRLHPELFDAYGLWYPGWSVALCCWDGTIEAEPLLWWYEPLPEFVHRHFLPGLDGHDGRVPDPSGGADVDHVIVVGSHERDHLPLAREILDSVPSSIGRFLPVNVRGGRIHRRMANGDWVLPKKGWTYGNAHELVNTTRSLPPGFRLAQ